MGISRMKMKFRLLIFCVYIIIISSQDIDHVEVTSAELCSNGTEDSCEAFNSTEPSTSPPTVEVTSVVNKKALPKKPITTIAKPGNKKSWSQNGSAPFEPRPECSCDATRGGCDINCCCDADCSASQRAVFTRCTMVTSALDTDYCLPPLALFRNNSGYQTIEAEGGVMCIVQANTITSTDFHSVPVLRTLTAVKKKLERHKGYTWTNPAPLFPVFEPDVLYDEKSPIWVSDNTTTIPLALPAAGGHSTLCLGSLVPKYMEEVETSCTMPLQDKSHCLMASYSNFSVISSPRNFNFTQPQECTEDICLPVRQLICSETCIERTIPPSSFNNSDNMCLNVVISVEYKIYHNGSQGIAEVKAIYILENLTVHEDQLVRKRYRITYKWAGSDGERSLKRSGHPGYRRGNPIISGRRTAKFVVVETSHSKWISVSVAGHSGYCSEKHNLLFKENLRSHCLLKVSGTCKQIQQQIWQQILGSSANMSELVISAYGDPRETDIEAWVPLLTSDLPPHPKLVSAVDIIVLHTLVGMVSKPQAKIIGTFFNILPSQVTCTSNLTEILVKTSVKFMDKTVPPVTKFAPPPVYEIKLPQDFFYPFFSSSGRQNCFTEILILSAIIFATVCM